MPGERSLHELPLELGGNGGVGSETAEAPLDRVDRDDLGVQAHRYIRDGDGHDDAPTPGPWGVAGAGRRSLGVAHGAELRPGRGGVRKAALASPGQARYRWHSQPESANECQGGPFNMKLHPLDDRIVVRPGESEETTASGLVIPDTAKEKPQQGEVLAVGPGRRSEDTGELIPLDVKAGDTVVYSKYGGTEITVEGEDLLILSARDVLAKLA